MKVKKLLQAILFAFISLVLALSCIGDVHAQDRDYGIHVNYDPTFLVQEVYPLKVGIDFFGVCENPKIWIDIDEEETLLLGLPENRDGSNIGYVDAVLEHEGYYTGTFYPFHTEKTTLPAGSKGVVKWAMIGFECGGEVIVWEQTNVGLLIAPINTYLPLFFGTGN